MMTSFVTRALRPGLAVALAMIAPAKVQATDLVLINGRIYTAAAPIWAEAIAITGDRIDAVGTTAQAYLRVPIGVAIGVTFLGESLSPTAWIGLACVIVGVGAMTIPARKAVATG